MDFTTTLALAGIGAVGIIACVLAWPRLRSVARHAGSSHLASTRSLRVKEMFGDPLLFTGDAAAAVHAVPAADCGGTSDGGGSGCD